MGPIVVQKVIYYYSLMLRWFVLGLLFVVVLRSWGPVEWFVNKLKGRKRSNTITEIFKHNITINLVCAVSIYFGIPKMSSVVVAINGFVLGTLISKYLLTKGTTIFRLVYRHGVPEFTAMFLICAGAWCRDWGTVISGVALGYIAAVIEVEYSIPLAERLGWYDE